MKIRCQLSQSLPERPETSSEGSYRGRQRDFPGQIVKLNEIRIIAKVEIMAVPIYSRLINHASKQVGCLLNDCFYVV